MWRVSSWQAKDYFLGLDPGLWMVGDAWQGVKLLTCGEPLLLWCMVPSKVREERINRVNKLNEDYNKEMSDAHNSDGPVFRHTREQATELPASALSMILLSLLELQLEPVSFLRKKCITPSQGNRYDAGRFYAFAAELRDPKTRATAWVKNDGGHPSPPMWVWVLSKYFRDCGCNAGNFMVALDQLQFDRFFGGHNLPKHCNPTTRFLVEFFPDDWIGSVTLFTSEVMSDKVYDIQSRILSGMTLGDLASLAAVNKRFRMGVWLHLFKRAPSRYVVPKTSTFAWLCAMQRLGIWLPRDIRKEIAKLAACKPRDVRVYWNN